MHIERLNSTESFTRVDGDYFSYDTRLSFCIDGQLFINKTYYSATTCKHQSNLPYVYFNHTLRYQGYGYVNEKKCIQREIEGLQHELKNRLTKRKTQNNLYEIDRVSKKLQFLSELYLEKLW